MSYSTISINIEDLENMYRDLSGCYNVDKAHQALLDAKAELDKIQTILEHSFSGAGANAFSDNISDIKDSERGIRNNMEEFSEKIEKFCNRREEVIGIKKRSVNIRVDNEIKDVNNDLGGVYRDIKDVLHGLTPHLGMGIDVVDEEKRCAIREINSRLDATNDIEKTKLNTIENLLDSAKEYALTMEEWYEDDYNEAYHIVKGVAIAGITAAAAAGIAAVLPIAGGALTVFAVGAGTVKAGKMFHNGNSATGSLAGGVVVGATTYVGGKAIDKGLRGSAAKKNILSEKAANLSDMSPELAETYTGNIKGRFIKLGLDAEELAIKNADDLGIDKTDEIMKLTDQYIDQLQLSSPQLEDFLDETIDSGARKLSGFLRGSANLDIKLAEGLENGSITISAVESVKLEIKNDIEGYINENSNLIDDADIDKTLDNIMDKVDKLLDKVLEGVV